MILSLLVAPFSSMLTFYKDSFITYSDPGSLKNCQNFLKKVGNWSAKCVHTQGPDPPPPLYNLVRKGQTPPPPIAAYVLCTRSPSVSGYFMERV